MKIGGNFNGFNISAEGLSVQRKKMNLIAENIANIDSSRSESGQPYKRKFLKIIANESKLFPNAITGNTLKLAGTNENHIVNPESTMNIKNPDLNISSDELVDRSRGELLYMPEHPDANEEGYVEMSNVNIITEMTDMIAATRSYEANLTALNASKQIVKDSLEI